MDPSHPTRREFAATLALAGLAACTSRSTSPAPGGAAAAVPAATPEPNARVVDALLGVVDARYAARLTTETRAGVRAGIARLERLGDALRAAPLANGVGPYSVCGAPARPGGGR